MAQVFRQIVVKAGRAGQSVRDPDQPGLARVELPGPRAYDELCLLPAKEDDLLNILAQLEQLLSLVFKNAVPDAFNLPATVPGSATGIGRRRRRFLILATGSGRFRGPLGLALFGRVSPGLSGNQEHSETVNFHLQTTKKSGCCRQSFIQKEEISHGRQSLRLPATASRFAVN